MVISFIRTVIIYLLVVTIYRIMGKRQIGELQPGELVLAIMVSDFATIPVSALEYPLTGGIFPVLVLMIIEIIFSYLSQKSVKIRKAVTGSPSIIIDQGKINMEEMNRLRFSIDDLFEQLRSNGYMTISEVSFAILETNGSLSIIPQNFCKPVTLSDLNISKPSPALPRNIIKDGVLDKFNLTAVGRDEKWLQKILKKNKTSVKDIFLLTSDGSESVYIQKKKG